MKQISTKKINRKNKHKIEGKKQNKQHEAITHEVKKHKVGQCSTKTKQYKTHYISKRHKTEKYMSKWNITSQNKTKYKAAHNIQNRKILSSTNTAQNKPSYNKKAQRGERSGRRYRVKEKVGMGISVRIVNKVEGTCENSQYRWRKMVKELNVSNG